MKERPILFSAPMVRALLDGSKTQTRQIVKPQPEISDHGNLMGDWLRRQLSGLLLPRLQDITIHCSYGQPGDRLWVRETWGYRGGQVRPGPETAVVEYIADGARSTIVLADGDKTPRQRDPREGESRLDYETYLHRYWKRSIPAIHMPRWASRITLEITAVRVERLQDISEHDAAAEGVATWAPGALSPEGQTADPSDQFRWLWNSINGPDSWSANPWVWVVEFRRVENAAR